MSLRGRQPEKQSPVLEDIAGQKEVAAPPKNKVGGSQRHKFTKCTLETENYNSAF
jgi:hypothetical protein